MVIIAGHLIVDASERDRFVESHRDLVTRARDFEGCLHLAITADSVDPTRVNNIEVWESSKVLDDWRARADAPDTGIAILRAEVRRYDATDGGRLF